MATVSNPATLQSVINTFGSGGSPTNLFAYRRGAGYVPDTSDYNVVSTTQPALSTFAGLTYPPLPNLPDYEPATQNIVLDYDYANPNAAACSVEIELNSDGNGRYSYINPVDGTQNFTTFTWRPSGQSSGNYYAYMDAPSGGTFSIGTVSTSLVLSTTRSWRLTAATSRGNSITRSLTSTLRIKDSGENDLVAKTLYMLVIMDRTE